MATLNFPSSPVVNDEYTLGDKTWVWTGTAWKVKKDGASTLLTLLSTVDGSGSGLDADLLDGEQGSYYLDYGNFTNTPTIPSDLSDLTDITSLLFDGAYSSLTGAPSLDFLPLAGGTVAGNIALPAAQFDINPASPPSTEGSVFWDSTYHTLAIKPDITSSTLQVGQEEWLRVRNVSGAEIADGSVVYISGVSGEFPTIDLADATDHVKVKAIGLTTSAIADSEYGFVTVRGLVHGLNTTGLTAGQFVYVSTTPGQLTSNVPTYPNYPHVVGQCSVTDSLDGEVYVDIENWHMEYLRVCGNSHFDGNLTIQGNLNVLGTQTTVSQSNLAVQNAFIYMNSGDNIGAANTTFSGSGLDDAYFTGHYKGTAASQTYYVRIDGVGTGTGGVDTFEWSVDNFSTTEATGVDITGDDQLLNSGINIFFNATTGHTLNDTWSGTASPVNVDTGWTSNRNTGAIGVGYTHMGVVYDVASNQFIMFDAYDPEPAGNIDTADASFSYGSLRIGDLTATSGTFSGNVSSTGTISATSFSGDGSSLTGINIPTNVSELTNDSGYITSYINTEYTHSLVDSGSAGVYYLRLSGSDSSTDDITIVAGTNVSFDVVGDQLTISSTDTNTTYSAGTGLSLSGTTFNHSNSVTAGTVSEGGSTRILAFGGTFNVPSVTYDAQGHVTSTTSITLTMPDNPNTDTHYTSKNIVGTSTSQNDAATTNGNTYLLHYEESNVTSLHKIEGTGATTVSSSSTGNITINSTDTNTTYSHAAVTTTGGAFIRLTGSDATNDDIKLASGKSITVEYTDANTITVNTSQWLAKTAAYTAIAGDKIVANTTSGSFTVTLPASPTTGDEVQIADGASWTTNALTIARNGSTIEGLAEDLIADIAGISLSIVYTGSTWQVFASAAGAELPSQAGNSGKYLTTNGSVASWAAVTSTTVSDDTTTDTNTFYPIMAYNQTSGGYSSAYVSSTKMYYNPSTGQLNSTSFNSLSDANKKTNVKTITNALATVNALRGVTFDWIDNGKSDQGVIAQELEAIIPELVSTSSTGEKSVSYGNIVGVLIEAIKDLSAQVNELKGIK